MEKKESRRKDMKKSKKKFIMFAILSVLLMANMKNVNAGQVQKNDKSVAIEELKRKIRTLPSFPRNAFSPSKAS